MRMQFITENVRSIGRKFKNNQNACSLLLGIIVPSIFINILSLALPLMLLQIYDRIIPNKAMPTFHMLLLIVIAAVIVEMVLKMARSYTTIFLSSKYEIKWSLKSFSRLLQGRLDDIKKTGPGARLEQLAASFQMKDFYGGQLLSIIIDLPFVIIYLTLIAYISGCLVAVPIIIIAIYSIAAKILGVKIQTLLNGKGVEEDRKYNFIIEMVGGIHIIKSLSMENFMLRRYERLQESIDIKDYQTNNLSLLSQNTSISLAQLNTIMTVSIGGMLIISGSLTIGGLVACTLLGNRCLMPVNQAMSLWRKVQSVIVSEKKAEQILLINSENTAKHNKKIRSGHIKINGACIVKNDKTILKDINLEVADKEIVGIYGTASSGKSTLINMILGIESPGSGKIEIDNININKLDRAKLRQQISYLPQHSKMYSGSIADNLGLFDSYCTLERSIELIKDQGYQNLIHRLKDGFHTQVGNRTVDFLAPGIIQQLTAIERLSRDSKIILFDEASEGLDLLSTHKLLKLVSSFKGKKTMIIVSQNKDFLSLAKTVYKLTDGKLLINKEAYE